MNLVRQLQAIEPGVGTSPWPGHELVRGYAMMVLPFTSGHLLGLRVWLRNDFAPYASVWHCTPDGDWAIYSDGPLIETTCPRYWGPALTHAELASIDCSWDGPNTLRVTMERPRLAWTMTMTAPPLLRALNRLSAALPLWTWKPALLQRVREWVAGRFLDMGDIQLSFTTPSGHDTIIMPEQLFFVASSEAMLEGEFLGAPVHLEENPTIGGVPLPLRPIFTIGQAHMRIRDPEEYRQTRARVADVAVPDKAYT